MGSFVVPLRYIRAFLRSTRGNFAVMTALVLPFAIVLTAFAVDVGSLYTERRHAQAITDIAAIIATANMANAEAVVASTLADNGLGPVIVRPFGDETPPLSGRPIVHVVKGRYVADSGRVIADRFKAGVEPYNAVRVSMKKIGSLYFASRVMAPPVIGTSAIASNKAEATFTVGSRLLRLDGGVVNALLGALLGGNISLSLMDYDALADADIGVLPFLDALATRIGITAGTYSEVLDSNVRIGQIAAAMADVPGLDGTSRVALRTLGAKSSSSLLVSLRSLIGLGDAARLEIGQHMAGPDITANVLSILTASAAIANGKHQVTADLGGTLPGLGALKINVAIGEPPQSMPWLAVGEQGTIVRTAQTRVNITANISPLAGNLGGGLHLLTIKLPLHVEVAYAEARLKSIECPTGRPESLRVQVDTTPGVAELYLADANGSGFADFTRRLQFRSAAIADASLKLLLIKLDLIKINGFAHAKMGNNVPKTLTFTKTDIDNRAIKVAGTDDYTNTLTSSLIDDLKLSVEPLGLGIDISGLLGTVTGAVSPALRLVTPELDKVLDNLLGLLGVRLGEADVRVTGATCARSLLVR